MSIWPFRRSPGKAETPPAAVRSERVLSFLSPDQVTALGGLPAEAIVGRFDGATASAEAFQQNRTFVDFMHRVIRTVGPRDPELQAAAREQGGGSVVIIDLRTPEGPNGRVPPEDIVGAFEVRNGHISEESYVANPNHRVYTRHGLVRLPPFLHQAILERLPKVG